MIQNQITAIRLKFFLRGVHSHDLKAHCQIYQEGPQHALHALRIQPINIYGLSTLSSGAPKEPTTCRNDRKSTIKNWTEYVQNQPYLFII